MKLKNLYKVVATASILLTSTLANAADSKIPECNQLISSINQLEPVVRDFERTSNQLVQGFKNAKDLDEIQKLATESAREFNTLASDLDSINQEIQLINLTDKQLNGLQNQYAQTGQYLSQGIRDMAQVMIDLSQVEETQAGLEKLNTIGGNIDSISQRLDNAAEANDKIVDQINSYCGAK